MLAFNTSISFVTNTNWQSYGGETTFGDVGSGMEFYRLEGSVSGGTGLGLSIVKGFVQAHNVNVVIENRENGGSIITVKIPTEIPDLNQILL